MQKIEIAYIGGGSRAWARTLMSDLAGQNKFCGRVRLYDIDVKSAEDNAVIGNNLNKSKNVKSQWEYIVKNTLRGALTGCDIVVISILPGTFNEMYSDVHTPEKYGIYQPVGDSVGPGGLIRAMRTIPMYEVFANAIKEACPAALVINYTNPMSVCVKTLYSVFPEIKAVGCCHEVFHTEGILAFALKEIKGIDITRHDLQTSVCGINHFTFITEAKYQDIDLYPVYAEIVDKYYYSGYNPHGGLEDYKTNIFSCSNRVKMDLFRRYGKIAAAGDRHLAEFCNNSWYLKDIETVKEWKFNLTPVEWRKKDEAEKIKITNEIISGRKKFEIFDTGEEGTRIIAAWLGLGDTTTNVNYPNKGQYVNAPKNSIVETTMKIGKGSIDSVQRVSLPDNLNSLVLRNLFNQETIVKACLKRDEDLLFTAFVNEPLCSVLDLKQAKSLFNEMIENTKKYLETWRI